MVDCCRQALESLPRANLIFTAHSIPVSFAQTSRYVEQLEEACAIPRERPIRSLRSAPRGLRIDVDPGDGVPLERAPHLVDLDRSAAKRDQRGPRALEELEHDVALTLTERRLPLALEEAGDWLSEALLQRAVGIERLAPCALREVPHRARLAGAHEADEDQLPGGAGIIQHARSREAVGESSYLFQSIRAT